MPVHGLPPRSPDRSGSRRPRPTGRPRRFLVPVLAVLLVLAVLAGAFFGIGFTWSRMVRDDAHGLHARWALVLDGWVPEGERAARGMALVRARQADSVLISGTQVAPGVWSSTFQVRAQAPESALAGRIGELRHGAHSTIEEATAATAFFRSRRIDTVLLVTSDYHTGRAASIFRRVAAGSPVYLAAPAIEARFANGWDRERLKTWLLESTKRLEWFTAERWLVAPMASGDSALVPWHAALGDSAGASPLFRSACPAVPVCPAPVVCPVCPAAIEPVVVPCPEAPKPAKAASEPKETKKVIKGDAKSTTAKKSSKPAEEPKKKTAAKEKAKR